jgi:predicted tellurium resistance membrane protein TerC
MQTVRTLIACQPMRKVHGWFMIFAGYAFALLGLAILLAYLQNFVQIMNANPYVLMIFVCTLGLNLMGAYVIHRSTE